MWTDYLGSCEFNGALVTLTEDIGRNGFMLLKDAFGRINGKWDRTENAFVFAYDAEGAIKWLESQPSLPKKNKYAYFPTPTHMLDNLADWTDCGYLLTTAKSIREPSAGTGNIANWIRQKAPNAYLDCCEFDPANVAVLRSQGHIVYEGDFLQQSTDDKFDLIIMNPPFQGINFAKHIYHAQKMLNPKGRIFAVIPEPWMNTIDPQKLLQQLRRDIITCNPSILREKFEDAFEGTSISTIFCELWHADAVNAENVRCKSEYIDEFNMYITNTYEYAEPIMKESNKVHAGETTLETFAKWLTEYVGSLMLELNSKTIQAIPEYTPDYVNDLLTCFDHDIIEPVENCGDLSAFI